jgi:hypothetical protein
MAATNRIEAREALRGGVVAGLIGGIVLSVFLVLLNVMRGYDPWVPLKMAAYPLLGELALDTGFELTPVALGFTIHLALSVGWGMLFAVLFYGMSRAATLATSLAWGIVVWLVMFYLVLPIGGAGHLVRGAPKGFAALEHLLFGLSIGLGFLPFQRPRPRAVDHRIPAM